MSSTVTIEKGETDGGAQEGMLDKWNAGLLGALADAHSRRILEAAIGKGLTVEEMSRAADVPLSSCYRLVKEFVEDGLMIIERIVITTEGKRYAIYRTTFSAVEVSLSPSGTKVREVPNEDVSEKVKARWLSMAYAPRPSSGVFVGNSQSRRDDGGN